MSWDSAAVEAYLVQLGKVQHTIQYWGEEAMVVSEDKTNVVSAGVLVRMKKETSASSQRAGCIVRAGCVVRASCVVRAGCVVRESTPRSSGAHASYTQHCAVANVL